MEQIKIKLNGGMMPKKATPFDAAYDVYVPEDTYIKKGRQVIDLGICVELPHGLCAHIRARSGYSLKGMEAMVVRYNGKAEKCRIDADIITGVVDEKYSGHVGAILNVHNIDGFYKQVYIEKGTRIAQMQIVAVPDTELVESDKLDMTDDRGGGFGHTNK